MMIDYHFVMKRFLNLLYLYQFICMIQGNYGTSSELWTLKDKSCVTDDVDVRSMNIWEKRCKGNKTPKNKKNGTNEKRPKKGGILTLSKIGICNQKQGSWDQYSECWSRIFLLYILQTRKRTTDSSPTFFRQRLYMTSSWIITCADYKNVESFS